MDFYDAWRINGNDALGPAAVSAMGMIRHPDSVKNLISYIDDEDPLIRINAISALGQIGDNSVLPHIAPALKDPESEVRIAAIKAIIKFGGEEATELAISALADENIRVRLIAVTRLIRLRDKHLPVILVQMLDDPDTNLRRTAALGLDKIGWHPPMIKSTNSTLLQQTSGRILNDWDSSNRRKSRERREQKVRRYR